MIIVCCCLTIRKFKNNSFTITKDSFAIICSFYHFSFPKPSNPDLFFYLPIDRSDMESPIFFTTPAEWRHWLEAQHKAEDYVWVGYYKKHTGIPSMTWEESVDEALCFGWIDGIRKRIDSSTYKIRFTPRKKSSIWSGKNLKRIKELLSADLVSPAGINAYEARSTDKSVIYAYENKDKAVLPPEYEQQLKAHPEAWAFFSEELAPSYRQTSIWWVIKAKQQSTRDRRIQILIDSCVEKRKIPPLRRKGD